jgi:predicted phage terminase large subunit-like protein
MSLNNLSLNLPTLKQIRQEKARRSLLDFTRYTYPNYLVNWHNHLICEALDQFLQDVIDKKSPRLMIFAPPRSGKTESVSRRFPAYTFGKYPDLSIIGSSYASELASRNNRDIQRIMESNEYREVFPGTNLSKRSGFLKNNDIFEIPDHAGSYRAAGVGAGITGMGGDILIIDDPIKDHMEARSEVVRNGIAEWYSSTAYTRLSPGGGVLIILTRWNEDDLAGRLIKQMNTENGDKFKIITFKAIADEDELPYRLKGEALHPERYSLKLLKAIQAVAGPYFWSALYQQTPTPAEGNIFHPDKLSVVEAIPAGTKFVRGWDFGGTEGAGSYTCGVKLGKTLADRYIIADVVRFQGAPHTVEEILLKTAQSDTPAVRVRIPQDPGQAGKAQVANFIKLLAGFTVNAVPVSGDKTLRAEPFAAQVNVGNVDMLRGDWNDALKAEMRSFPNAKDKDQVDASADAFNEFNAPTTTGFIDYLEQQVREKLVKELRSKNPQTTDEEIEAEFVKRFKQ